MNVIMNSKGQYANVSESQTHVGTRQNLHWGELNSATLFNNRVSKRDYNSIYDELNRGIFIEATVSRVVTLIEPPKPTVIPDGAQYYHNSTYYRLGDNYALYYQNGWRASATLSNERLMHDGVLINAKPVSD